MGIKSGSTEPRKATAGSAAYDFQAAQTVTIKAGDVGLVPLNVQLDIPQGVYLQLYSRSGLALKNIWILGGVIDSDYRGEVKAIVKNGSNQDFKIRKKQRIVQGIFFSPIPIEFKTKRDHDFWTSSTHSGFGSTDI